MTTLGVCIPQGCRIKTWSLQSCKRTMRICGARASAERDQRQVSTDDDPARASALDRSGHAPYAQRTISPSWGSQHRTPALKHTHIDTKGYVKNHQLSILSMGSGYAERKMKHQVGCSGVFQASKDHTRRWNIHNQVLSVWISLDIQICTFRSLSSASE